MLCKMLIYNFEKLLLYTLHYSKMLIENENSVDVAYLSIKYYIILLTVITLSISDHMSEGKGRQGNCFS